MRPEPEQLSGGKAVVKVEGEQDLLISFRDATLTWEAGKIMGTKDDPSSLHAEIKGYVDGNGDHRHIKGAELILDDGRVFTITFVHPTYFFAHEPMVPKRANGLSSGSKSLMDEADLRKMVEGF